MKNRHAIFYSMLLPVILMFIGCSSTPVDPDTPFIIEGELSGVPDKVKLALVQWDGRTGRSIAIDTLTDGKFRFEEKMTDFLNCMSITAIEPSTTYAEGFPNNGRTIYVEPAAYIKVKGNNTHIITWDVNSKVPEQKEYDKILNAAKAEYEAFQEIAIQEVQVLIEMNKLRKSGDTSDKTLELLQDKRNEYQALIAQSDSLSNFITLKKVEKMRHMKPSDPWLNELYSIARMSIVYADYKYKNEAVELYNGLTDEMKQTEKAKEIYAFLNPPERVKTGDYFPDATFYDLMGNMHHIAEHQGKYILLDFWSSGCGPCIKAFPEMKELYEKFQDRLAIVSMSIDTDRRWRQASERHDITWDNWNEGKGMGGLYTDYRITAIPHYVVISPDGRILEQITAFNKTYFEELLSKLLVQQ